MPLSFFPTDLQGTWHWSTKVTSTQIANTYVVNLDSMGEADCKSVNSVTQSLLRSHWNFHLSENQRKYQAHSTLKQCHFVAFQPPLILIYIIGHCS